MQHLRPPIHLAAQESTDNESGNDGGQTRDRDSRPQAGFLARGRDVKVAVGILQQSRDFLFRGFVQHEGAARIVRGIARTCKVSPLRIAGIV